MVRFRRFLGACIFLAATVSPASALAPGTVIPIASSPAASKSHHDKPEPAQETGFLNRRIELHGVSYRFQVYLPEEWRRDDHKLWPIILFLHGRGERGSEGMWQTQIGLPEAVRDHPERWPFVIVLPQCPQTDYWTDPEMMAMAMATLDRFVHHAALFNIEGPSWRDRECRQMLINQPQAEEKTPPRTQRAKRTKEGTPSA